MTMICRITDETINNPWDEDGEEVMPSKSISDLTLYDMMGEDLTVWVGKNSKFGFDLEIENDDGQMIVEKGVHEFAMEGFADFCRRFLYFYDKVAQ